MLEQMGAYHPQAPHWYLPMIGVDPPYQGKGYGGALLKYGLEQCDRDHTGGIPGVHQPQKHSSVCATALKFWAKFKWVRRHLWCPMLRQPQ